MNRYKLSKAGISATEGIARFNGNAETYEAMLQQFLQDRHYEELLCALDGRDTKAAFAAAHSIKGMAGNLSMNRLYQDISPLVEVLREEKLDGADELLLPVKADYEAIVAALL